MDEKRVYLIRHAEPQKVDDKKRYLGQSDPGLSDQGGIQAKALAEVFSLKDLFSGKTLEIYCSDLKRARQTAQIIAAPHDIIPRAVKALREIDMGMWDGKSFEEVKRKYPEAYQRRGEDIGNFRPPDGESFSDLETRVVGVFEKICHNISDTGVIVAHAGVNRVILRRLLGYSFDEIFTIRQTYACINLIRISRVKELSPRDEKSTSHSVYNGHVGVSDTRKHENSGSRRGRDFHMNSDGAVQKRDENGGKAVGMRTNLNYHIQPSEINMTTRDAFFDTLP